MINVPSDVLYTFYFFAINLTYSLSSLLQIYKFHHCSTLTYHKLYSPKQQVADSEHTKSIYGASGALENPHRRQ